MLAGLGLTIVLLSQSCSSDAEHKVIDGKALPTQIDYNFHVKPILSDRCFACHGPDETKRSANLRLDTKEGMFSQLESGGFAIVKGKPRSSKILKRIHSEDPAFVMPPPESNLSLTNYEIAILENWISQGAEHKQHWAFIPPQKTPLPSVSNAPWVRNDIDAFVLQKIEAAGLQPSAEASKETLIRRLSLDLTGLPPSLEEVDEFLNDESEDAYENLVDRLLASERFGERMAADWLAVSRYGDTHGYEADSRRMAWQWRDWVIRAFNRNQSYDEFITDQLAGDLRENASREQLIATSFNRNHLMNSENGILDEEWRVEYVSDRTNTAGKAILGLTMECAKCHDHKYDPITQKEYYSLYAFFNNVDENGQIRWQTQAAPVLDLTSNEEDEQLAAIERQTAEHREAIADYIATLKKSSEWKTQVASQRFDLNKDLEVHITFEEMQGSGDARVLPNSANSARPLSFTGDEIWVPSPAGRALEYDGTNETILKDAKSCFSSHEPFSHAAWIYFPEPFQHGRILGTEDGTFDKVPGLYLYIEDDKLTCKLANTWDYNLIEVTTRESFPFSEWTHVVVTYNGSSSADGLRIFLNGEEMAVKVIRDNLTKNLPTMAWFKLGHRTFDGGAIDEYRQYSRVLTIPEIHWLAYNHVSREKELTEEDWFDWYLHQKDQRLTALRDSLSQALAARIKILDSVPQLMVMGDLRDSVRPTFVLNRGIYDDPLDQVFPGTPVSVMSFPEEFSQDRLGLSQWLFEKENPLTSRVYVNRLWQTVFGRGIVSTPDDFGNQGSLPTHPELLDWLAVDFQENNWNIKATLKKMVLSSTYRQSSVISEELLEVDPSNELLARAPSYRLPAEMIRDNVLAVSGLLVDSIGGKPVKPYQPEGIWAQISSLNKGYVQDHGERLYRRSLYTYWKRAAPPPNMLIFDAPSRHTCAVTREATSTPLQALVLLNDVQFVEAARVFAQNLLAEELDRDQTLEKAFRMVTSRRPGKEETSILLELWDESLTGFRKAPNEARMLIQSGEYPLNKNIDEVELAAFSIVVSGILNLNESITKR